MREEKVISATERDYQHPFMAIQLSQKDKQVSGLIIVNASESKIKEILHNS